MKSYLAGARAHSSRRYQEETGLTPKSDETVRSGTLPPPELNPLLNPILNKNLGRWAEVYFTNPPDKRDEAVLNLVHQLESVAAIAEEPPRSSVHMQRQAISSEFDPNVLMCRECGFENEIHQKFCGDCGALLGASSTADTKDFRPHKPEPAGLAGNEPAPPESESVNFAPPQFGSILHLADSAPLTLGGKSARDYSEPDDAASFAGVYAEPARLKRSYRVSIGVALAVIIGGLVYVAWRGGQASPDQAILPAPSPPPVTQPAPSREPAQTASAPGESASPTSAPSTPAAGPVAETPGKNSLPPAQTKDSNSVNAPVPSTGGSEELATALGFLNGVGHQRDTAQAAQWLWKSVEKQNTAATVLLAGLYLHGDGVPKSCDQGRILLDAAAIKGNKEAATLLRNLQAFGCE